MPELNKHTLQAQHNCSLLNSFITNNLQGAFADWYCTVAFYSAVHYMEALFCVKKPKILCENGLKVPVSHSDEGKRVVNQSIKTKLEEYKRNNDNRLFSVQPKHIASDHQARKRILQENQDNSVFKTCFIPYCNLEEVCRKARYYCNNPKSYNYVDAETDISAIKAIAEKHIKKHTKDQKP